MTDYNRFNSVRLGDIAEEIRYGYTASASETDGPRFLRITDIQNGDVDWTTVPGCSISAADCEKYSLREGDIVFARTGATTGKTYLLKNPPPAVFASYLIRVRLAASARPAFAFWFFQSMDYWRQITEKRKGIAQPGVNASSLAQIELPLPPLEVQDAIVSEIEKHFTRIDAAADSLSSARIKARAYRESVLNSAAQGKLFVAGRNEQSDQELPPGWRWALMSELSEDGRGGIFAGPFGTLFKAKDFRPKGVPIIFLRHVAAGRYLTHKPGYMDEQRWRQLFQPYSVHGGELLVTKLGEPPGVAAIYPHRGGPAMVTPDVIAMRVNETLAETRYLMHYLNSQVARRIAFGLAFGTTRLRLTLPLFRGLRVPLPPLSAQREIAAEIDRRFSILEHVEQQALREQLHKAESLRRSVLQRAFSGDLIGGTDRRLSQQLEVV